jgi:hypothetical protein
MKCEGKIACRVCGNELADIEKEGIRLNKRAFGLVSVLLALAVLAGCKATGEPPAARSASGQGDAAAGHQHHADEQTGTQAKKTLNEHQTQAANGDILEWTSGKEELPSFLLNVDRHTRNVYKAVVANVELLKWIPCYCGCGKDGHLNNAQCFVQEIRPQGAVLWVDHGIECDTCLEIAKFAIGLQSQGKSVKEIRKMVDERYKGKYPDPTPTPMPE